VTGRNMEASTGPADTLTWVSVGSNIPGFVSMHMLASNRRAGFSL
jgi:hypothetical protein